MNNSKLYLILMMLLIGLVWFLAPLSQSTNGEASIEVPLKQPAQAERLFFEGERLEYTVKMGLMKIGSADIVFKGIDSVDGKECYHIVFSVNTLSVKDVEDIYADKETFLPYRIYRKVHYLGKDIRAVEEYDQENFKVEVFNLDEEGKKLGREHLIEKDAPINNVILMAYIYRLRKDLKIGEEKKLNFPTKEVQMKVTDKRKVKVYFGAFEAFEIESEPPQYKIWISASEERLPLRINGGVAIGSASMFLTQVKTGDQQ